MFADRTNWELATNKLSILLQELRQQKIDLFDLTESNPTHCGFSYPEEILSALVNPKNLQYVPEPQGMLSARQAVCAYYKSRGIRIEPEQVFLTASTSEAYSFLFRLLLNPGEEALFPAPSYPLFQFLVDLSDITMGTYPLIYVDGGWAIDRTVMESKISADTKAIVLVNPNNPTGSYIKPAELAVINQCCGRHDLAIIADEVFLDYPLEEKKPRMVSLAENDKSLTFVMGGLSKALALPQMKLAWIVVNGPREKVKTAVERLEVITDTYLSVNAPVQNAVSVWFQYQNVIQGQILERVRRNRDYLLRNLSGETGIKFLNVEGGWYAVLKIPDKVDEEALALELLQKDHVYIHPGYFFDFSSGSHAVVSLLPREDVFEQGIQRLAQRIK